MRMYGFELEGTYHSDSTRFLASHGYHKLIEMVLVDPTQVIGYTSQPYGYGNDLANWSNHTTKIACIHELSSDWSINSSLRVYWGFPGAKDQSDHNQVILATDGAAESGLALADPGNEKPFGVNVYLNLGAERRLNDNFLARVDLYNVLGWFDPILNKRNYIFRGSEYRVLAPSVGLTLRAKY